MGMDWLIEQQIRRSQMKGSMDHLSGEGKPIPRRSGTNFAQAARLRIANEMGGSVDQELALRREIDDLVERADAEEDADVRAALKRKIARKRLKLSVYEDARRG